ncbi:protein phosphatase 1 regulatory subunit 32 isoform X1 [Amblyraja radiata]|uniref:protein phosphatase 1 regulatory subunit 32 isoform X1 n=2 Tax=Amblyraja radiata TaxID=386614 RepID=UPI00140344C6|nr:protein phosphatase 1 regulatory subunit 32 isoform X1 [Amblyraja radiata]XP_032894930.1 protein phosphatase 1 regulatory subunit 32 isoform X1 [Amblyraja radiata]
MALLSVDRTPHYTKTSFGADVDPLKFYSTTYSTSFGHEGFVPRTGNHSGAGFVTNIRPVQHYTPSLDRLDNPVLGQMLKDNYLSITKKNFVPYGHPDGKEDFPHKLHSVGSGFMRTKPLHFPYLKDLKEVHIDTRDHVPPIITRKEPKHVPLLHQLQPKDPALQENEGHGPLYMSTEYCTKYERKPLNPPALSELKTIGKKENTGFTEGSPLKPITFHPPLAFRGDKPAFCTDRPTGISITKSDYLPSATLHGDEFLPVIANKSDRSTGFTHQIALNLDTVQSTELQNLPVDKIEKLKKDDPVEYLHRTHLDEPSSINTLTYTDRQQRPVQNILPGNIHVGSKETTGFTANENVFVYPAKTATDADRFLTNYNLRYNDKTPKGEDREGWTRGGILKQVPDGFMRSTTMHKHGPDYNITESLRRTHPHVARTIKSVDEHHDDHMYDHKQRPPGLIL